MIWATTAVVFVAALAIGVVLYIALVPSTDAMQARLAQLWNTVSPADRPARFADKQKHKLARALTRVGQLIPVSEKKLSRSHQLMIRAGLRSPNAVKVHQGVRVFLPALLVGGAVLAGLYKINPMLVVAAGGAGFLLPDFWLASRVKRRQTRIVLALPDALDLLVVCVEAGMGLDQAILRVSQELRIAHPELSDELQVLNLEMRMGKSRMESLRELAGRTGVEDINAFVVMLIQADRFGTDLVQSLRVHSDDLRTKRRQRAEEMAAKATVKMIPPLVFFIFPAMFAVLLGPAVISIVRAFHIGAGGGGP